MTATPTPLIWRLIAGTAQGLFLAALLTIAGSIVAWAMFADNAYRFTIQQWRVLYANIVFLPSLVIPLAAAVQARPVLPVLATRRAALRWLGASVLLAILALLAWGYVVALVELWWTMEDVP